MFFHNFSVRLADICSFNIYNVPNKESEKSALHSMKHLCYIIVNDDGKTTLNQLKKYQQKFISKISEDIEGQCSKMICDDHLDEKIMIGLHWLDGRIKVTLFCCCPNTQKTLQERFKTYHVPVRTTLASPF